MKEKNIKLVYMVLLSAVFISGCAFGTRRPVLKYTIGTEPQSSKGITVYVSPFVDDWVDKNVIDHVRNGWGLKTAKVVTETNISNWVTDALKSELKNIGYSIANDSTTPIKISGEIVEVYVTSFMLYEGRVVVEVSLLIDNEKIFTEKYSGNDESLNWAATAKSYGITLERSLQTALKRAVYDIDRHISAKYER